MATEECSRSVVLSADPWQVPLELLAAPCMPSNVGTHSHVTAQRSPSSMEFQRGARLVANKLHAR